MMQIEMYGDLSCPFAYVVNAWWRQVRPDYAGRVEIVHRSLALEYVNKVPTPKPTLDVELPILLANEPAIPYAPWSAPVSEWPVTIWPAFEAVKCAERQNLALADDLAWAIRVAFFAESRCISMRHVLLEIAERVGLDMARFEADFDSGTAKPVALNEARDGWERLDIPGSPTWVLPSGERIADFGFPDLDIDDRNRPSIKSPASCQGEECTARLREILDRALAG